jgi:hypothetical protein
MRCARSETIAFSLFRGFVFWVLVCAAAVLVVACRKAPSDSPAAAPAAGRSQADAASTVPHGDHNPHHGGVVSMKGDLHYEVVLDPAGKAHHLFFTDAIREELPASIATGVALTIHRPGAPDELIAMTIDEFGESWVGSGRTVEITPATKVRVAFSIHDEPYWIDIPYGAPPAAAKP